MQHSRPDLAVGVSMVNKKLQGVRTMDMRKLIKLLEKVKEYQIEVEIERLKREELKL